MKATSFWPPVTGWLQAMHQAWLTPVRRRALGDGLWLLAVLALLAYLALFVIPAWVGLDGHAYWQAWQGPGLYAAPPASPDAYLYSPLFAQLIRPLALLPWPAFLACWALLQAAVFAWLLRPLPARWFIVAYLACLPEILEANVNGLYALMIVLGFRWSGGWAFALITKIAPGVGLLWFATRHEWRQLAVPLGLTVGLVALSALVWPAAWQEWVAFLVANSGGGGGKTAYLLPRFLLGAVVVVLGARTDRRWAVPLAVALASPVLFLNSLTVLAALPRLRQAQLHRPLEATASPGPRQTAGPAPAA